MWYIYVKLSIEKQIENRCLQEIFVNILSFSNKNEMRIYINSAKYRIPHKNDNRTYHKNISILSEMHICKECYDCIIFS